MLGRASERGRVRSGRRAACVGPLLAVLAALLAVFAFLATSAWQAPALAQEGEGALLATQAGEASVAFDVDPEGAIVCVYDASGKRVKSTGDGRTFEGLVEGATYTYTATKYACVGQKGTFAARNGATVEVSLSGADATHPSLKSVEWWNYRNSYENNAVTPATTPITREESKLRWKTKMGTGGATPTPPLVADGCLYTAAGKFVYKVDKATGETLAVSDELAGSADYALNAMTYAEGMLFVQVGQGRIQALSATTLKSLWVSEAVGGQTLSPIAYRDGYIYTGTWKAESSAGEYLCMSVTDEDPEKPDEVKLCAWRWSRVGGFYWAGAYVDPSASYVVFGTDDGAEAGNFVGEAALVSVKPSTGEEIDAIEGVIGDVRSSVVYDDGFIYFVTKGNYLYRVAVDASGHFDHASVKSIELGGMSTSSPVVRNGRVYVGVSAADGQFGDGAALAVFTSDSSGLSAAYRVTTPGYPQAAVLATSAYEGGDYNGDGRADGRVYVYFTCNIRPGGIYMIADAPGARSSTLVELWTPDRAQQQYCISPICSDAEGTLYYRNDSGYMFAVTANDAYLNGARFTPDKGSAAWDGAFDPSLLGYTITVPDGAKSVSVSLDVPAGRSVTVGGAAYRAGMKVALDDDSGVTHIPVVVTFNGKQRAYDFAIEVLGSDASLSDIVCSTSNNVLALDKRLELSPAFDSATSSYVAAECDEGRAYVNLWAVPTASRSTVQVEAVSGVRKVNAFRADEGSYGRTRYAVYFGDNEARARVRVVVTAPDGVSQREYNVELRRPDIYAPKLEDGRGHRFSAADAAALFTTNEDADCVWAVTGASDGAPARPSAEEVASGSAASGARVGACKLKEGACRIDLSGIGPDASAVWLWATDAVGNAAATPVRISVAAWATFTLTLDVNPADATVTLADEFGASVPISGGGAARTATLIDGNRYTLHAERSRFVGITERFTADKANTRHEVRLKDLRSSVATLRGLRVSSSSKWGKGLQALSPAFAATTKRYSVDYAGERTHMYLWPTATHAKATVSVYAIGGVREDTIAKDGSIAGETVDGHPFWQVYFAEGSYEAQVRVHVVAEDGTANDYFVTLTIHDVTPPALSKVSVKRASAKKATVIFKTTEGGRYWYKFVKKGKTAPKLRTKSGGKEMARGTITIKLKGLAKGAYDLYVVGVDDAGNKGKVLKIAIPNVKAKSSGGAEKGSSGQGSGSGAKDGSSSGTKSGTSSSGLKKISGSAGGDDAQSGATGSTGATGGTPQAISGSVGGATTGSSSTGKSGSSTGSGTVTHGKTAAKKGSSSGASAAKSGKSSSGDSNGSGAGGAGSGAGSGGASASGAENASTPEGAANVSALEAIAELPWWTKLMMAVAGLGLAYIAFWTISAAKRKRLRATAAT